MEGDFRANRRASADGPATPWHRNPGGTQPATGRSTCGRGSDMTRSGRFQTYQDVRTGLFSRISFRTRAGRLRFGAVDIGGTAISGISEFHPGRKAEIMVEWDQIPLFYSAIPDRLCHGEDTESVLRLDTRSRFAAKIARRRPVDCAAAEGIAGSACRGADESGPLDQRVVSRRSVEMPWNATVGSTMRRSACHSSPYDRTRNAVAEGGTDRVGTVAVLRIVVQ